MLAGHACPPFHRVPTASWEPPLKPQPPQMGGAWKERRETHSTHLHGNQTLAPWGAHQETRELTQGTQMPTRPLPECLLLGRNSKETAQWREREAQTKTPPAVSDKSKARRRNVQDCEQLSGLSCDYWLILMCDTVLNWKDMLFIYSDHNSEQCVQIWIKNWKRETPQWK